MQITTINPKCVLNYNDINELAVINIFFEFGKIVIYVIDDKQKLLGIITYGEWVRNKENRETWINFDFKVLKKSDDKIFEKAKTIFNKNQLINIIPVIEDDNMLTGEIREFFIEDIERLKLQNLFHDLQDTLLNSDMQNELTTFKNNLEDKKVLLIGHNYLSEYFKANIFDRCIVDEFSWDRIKEIDNYSIIIDMDVYAENCRYDLLAFELKKFKGLYSCASFLKDLIYILTLEIFTTLERATKNPYFTLKDTFEFYNIQNIYLRNKIIMLDKLCKYFDENKINYSVYDDVNSYLNWDEYSYVEVSKSQLYPLINDNTRIGAHLHLCSLLRYSIESLEFIEARKYIEDNYKEIHIFDFYINTKIDNYHNDEQERFSKNITIENLISENRLQELENFYELKFNSVEDVNNFIYIPTKHMMSRGIISENRFSNNRCYINGIRTTIGTKENYKNTIYCFGACLCEGFLVIDKDTIESHLQNIINENNYDYRVINLGAINQINISKMAKSIEFQVGDIVVNFFHTMNDTVDHTLDFIRLKTLENYKNDKDNNEVLFMDMPIHCNGKANSLMAKEIFDIVEKLMKRTDHTNLLKKHSYYNIFNNDDDLEYLKYKMSDYFCYLEKKKINNNESGAVVVNCNPFTLGHLHLIEYASKKVNNLYVFVVEEDKSYFKFQDRYDMVCMGVEHLSNVRVLKSGKFIASDITMPGYFRREMIRDSGLDTSSITMDVSIDLRIFGKYIAPYLHITKRFIGEELHDAFTKQYNVEMIDILPLYDIEIEEIPRLHIEDNMVISAKTVRSCLKLGDYDLIKRIVPDTTYQWLLNSHMN